MLTVKGYTVESAVACSEVDYYQNGMCGELGASWTVELDKGKVHDTIEDALRYVCKSLCFDYDLSKHWFWDDCNEEFVGDFLVNDDNEEVMEKYSKSTIDAWKEGKIKLCNCRVSVGLAIVTKHDLPEIDVEKWRNKYEQSQTKDQQAV